MIGPQKASGAATPHPDVPQKPWSYQRAGRVSALEVAIRAQAKHFLAHPLVVQHLEAIWAGTIVFLASPAKPHLTHRTGYGAGPTSRENLPLLANSSAEFSRIPRGRAVALYDPRNASLFKLSRLRVPRYRSILSTCSLAVLLALYLAVLIEQPFHLTTLEIVFWFWSAGYMLDEIVGFNEQGFSLYIMSFWNVFDLGILLLLIVYSALRVYGILVPSEGKRQAATDMAYDVLGSTAVLLFPRLFSILDHYRYFSQLLVAFRLMAIDLTAVFILIMISCSGFFVAFTLSFGNDDEGSARAVAYSLFQMILGFTPAAWNVWDKYNALGRVILTLFLFICHFLIVTILITVLTNSFMAIVANANEEHQFLFAVNTISMVKSDALFAYVAPTNVLAWMLAPSRYFLPAGTYVKLNRTVIKVTHFPILLLIYLYERVVLRKMAFEQTDLLNRSAYNRSRKQATDAIGNGLGIFKSNVRMRQDSKASLQKEQALEAVFRRPFRGSGRGRPKARRDTTNEVSTWMHAMGPDGRASPPLEQDPSLVDRLEARPRRPRMGPRMLSNTTRDFTDFTRSAVSDPEDFVTSPRVRRVRRRGRDQHRPNMGMDENVENTGAEGDDELLTNDETEDMSVAEQGSLAKDVGAAHEGTSHRRPVASRPQPPEWSRTTPAAGVAETTLASEHGERQHYGHRRIESSITVLHVPPSQGERDETRAQTPGFSLANRETPTGSGGTTPKALAGKQMARAPASSAAIPRSRARPIVAQSAPSFAGMAALDRRPYAARRRTSPSMSDVGRRHGGNDDDDDDHGDDDDTSILFPAAADALGAVPASFATQMAIATGTVQTHRHNRERDGGDAHAISRLMLARMRALEQGHMDIIKELKLLRRRRSSNGGHGEDGGKGGGGGGGSSSGTRSKKAARHGRRYSAGLAQVQESESAPAFAPTSASASAAAAAAAAALGPEQAGQSLVEEEQQPGWATVLPPTPTQQQHGGG